jgi:hypothetical protein
VSAEVASTVPSLFIAGQCDPTALPCLVRRMFRAVRAPKLLLEVRRGDHAIANGPAGSNICQVAWGFGALSLCVIVPGICCGSHSPCGAFDRPTGSPRDEARNGAIGGTALKWLSIYLRGEEGDEPVRPSIASDWKCVGMETMSRA